MKNIGIFKINFFPGFIVFPFVFIGCRFQIEHHSD